MNRLTFGLPVFLVASFCGPTAKANVTYTYTGNDFTTVVGSPSETTSDFITASFTFASPLLYTGPSEGGAAELSWTISDGVESLSSADFLGSTGVFGYNTDASGHLLNWNFQAWGQGPCVVSGGTCTNPIFRLLNETAGEGGFIFDEVGYYASGGVTPAWYAENSGDPGTWTQTGGSAVPEPSTFLLLSVGFAMATVFRLTKRSRKNSDFSANR